MDFDGFVDARNLAVMIKPLLPRGLQGDGGVTQVTCVRPDRAQGNAQPEGSRVVVKNSFLVALSELAHTVVTVVGVAASEPVARLRVRSPCVANSGDQPRVDARFGRAAQGGRVLGPPSPTTPW